MAWTTPRTWVALEVVTASIMNTHVRDNLNVLKTQVDNDGSLRTLLKGFAFSSGQGNAGGGGDTQLTSYTVTIPANFLSQPGDALVMEGTLTAAANTNSKVMKVAVNGVKVTVFTNAQNVANHIVTFRLMIRYRTGSTGSITGYFHYGSANQAASTVWMVNAALGASPDFTASQALDIYLASATANDLKLTDYFVDSQRGLNGVTV